jgi:hypothetical protein
MDYYADFDMEVIFFQHGKYNDNSLIGGISPEKRHKLPNKIFINSSSKKKDYHPVFHEHIHDVSTNYPDVYEYLYEVLTKFKKIKDYKDGEKLHDDLMEQVRKGYYTEDELPEEKFCRAVANNPEMKSIVQAYFVYMATNQKTHFPDPQDNQIFEILINTFDHIKSLKGKHQA